MEKPYYLANLLILIAMTFASNIELSILVEGSIIKQDIGVSLTHPALNASMCDEFTAYGSVLLSGVELITNFFNANYLFGDQSRLFGIVSNKCIAESAIVQYLLQSKMNLNSTVPMLLLQGSTSHFVGPDIFYMSPALTQLFDAFFILCKSLEWNRISIITNSYNKKAEILSNYLQHASEEQNISTSLFMDLAKTSINQNVQTNDTLNALKDSGIKIVLMTVLSSQVAHIYADILCTAYHMNMIWPQYAWVIYVNKLTDDILRLSCAQEEFLEGIIFLSYDFNIPLNRSTKNDVNLYSLQEKLIRDAVGLLKEASNKSQDMSAVLKKIHYEGITGNIVFDATNHVKRDTIFIQLMNAKFLIQIRIRNGKIQDNNWLLSQQQLPTSTLPIRVNTVYPLWLNIVEVIVCTIAITTVLVLFIYFRNEPEIKATSWLLSLLMILSCYMVVANLLAHAIHTSLPPVPHFNTCSFMTWIGYGLPQSLIIAVLLVKMLRVYHIFHKFHKLGKLSSNYAMAVYIFLILSPNILVLVIMTALSSYRVSAIHTFHTGYVEVKYICMGNIDVYFLTSQVYQLLLTFCTAIVALTTRKLRLKHFRDAKKVNGYFLTLLFIVVPASVLIGIFRSNDQYLQSYFISHFCYNVFIFSCLGFLFVPKIYPVIYKRYFKE